MTTCAAHLICLDPRFFPILASTTLGVIIAAHNLVHLFQLYRASRWQIPSTSALPAAMPYFLGCLRSPAGCRCRRDRGRIRGWHRRHQFGPRLSATGSTRMFAAVLLISATGVQIFKVFTLLAHLIPAIAMSAVRRGALKTGGSTTDDGTIASTIPGVFGFRRRPSRFPWRWRRE
jgi:NitT/TauT family transport system permease protein